MASSQTSSRATKKSAGTTAEEARRKKLRTHRSTLPSHCTRALDEARTRAMRGGPQRPDTIWQDIVTDAGRDQPFMFDIPLCRGNVDADADADWVYVLSNEELREQMAAEATAAADEPPTDRQVFWHEYLALRRCQAKMWGIWQEFEEHKAAKAERKRKFALRLRALGYAPGSLPCFPAE